MKCNCGRELNLTDWNYGKCIKCKDFIDIETWKIIGGITDEIDN